LYGFTRPNLFRIRQYYEAYPSALIGEGQDEPKVSAVPRQSHPQALDVFKDSYLVEFLDLPVVHSEADL
jgi:predicted nuclease of restriction endonuclease-like (RecB) superfamily